MTESAISASTVSELRKISARSKLRKALVLGIISTILILFALANFVGRNSFRHKITDIDTGVPEKNVYELLRVTVSRIRFWQVLGANEEYALVFSVDSKYELPKIAEGLILNLDGRPEPDSPVTEKNLSISRFVAEIPRIYCFTGQHGRGGIRLTVRSLLGSSERVFENVSLHGVRFIGNSVPKRIDIILGGEAPHEEFGIADGIPVKAQLWVRRGDKWSIASDVFEKKF
jgi:hypothetical protein